MLAFCPVLLTALVAGARAEESTSEAPATTAESPAPAPTTAAPGPTPEEIEALRERLRRLEQQLDQQQAAPTAATPIEIPLDLETRLHGYADLQLKSYEGEPLTFVLGDMTLSYDANLDRKVGFHSDVVFAVEDDDVEVEIDAMEIIAYPNDNLTVTAGRFYTPLSRWADNNFNGAYRYLTVLLPEVLLSERDEGNLPIHLVGIAADGRVPVGYWYVRYHASVTNGRSASRGRVSQGFDNEWLKSPLVGLWLESPGGVVFGGAAFYDYITPGATVEPDELAAPLHEITGSVSLDYKGPRVQVLGEGFVVNHIDPATNQTTTNLNGYLQGGYTFRRATPYLKVETMERKVEDPYYSQLTEPVTERKLAAGLRYDLGIHAAIKLEVSYCMETEYELETEEDGEVELEIEQENNPGYWLQIAAGF